MKLKHLTASLTVALFTPLVVVTAHANQQHANELPTSQQVSRIATLLEAHDCWTEQAPAKLAGQLPGHVVVTQHGRTVYSARLVSAALAHVFDGEYPGMRVHGFCR